VRKDPAIWLCAGQYGIPPPHFSAPLNLKSISHTLRTAVINTLCFLSPAIVVNGGDVSLNYSGCGCRKQRSTVGIYPLIGPGGIVLYSTEQVGDFVPGRPDSRRGTRITLFLVLMTNGNRQESGSRLRLVFLFRRVALSFKASEKTFFKNYTTWRTILTVPSPSCCQNVLECLLQEQLLPSQNIFFVCRPDPKVKLGPHGGKVAQCQLSGLKPNLLHFIWRDNFLRRVVRDGVWH